jgi:hypothetical protein
VATSDTIKNYYQNILQRDASQPDIDHWVREVEVGGRSLDDIRQFFVNSAEADHVESVIRLYQSMFGRVPDKGGLDYWVDTGWSIEQIADAFAQTAEFQQHYGSGAVTAEVIESMYSNLLGRTEAPSEAEVSSWINSGLSLQQIVCGFSESDEYKVKTAEGVSSVLDKAGRGDEKAYQGGLFNDAPISTGSADLPAAVNNGQAILLKAADLLGKVTDFDGDTLTILSVSVDPQYGAVVDNKDGTWSYTPAAGTQNGVFFGMAVTDGKSAPVFHSAVLPVTLGTPVPVVGVTADKVAVDEGSSVVFTIETTATEGA